jgi:GNAT superfamily N-acetyltransferase
MPFGGTKIAAPGRRQAGRKPNDMIRILRATEHRLAAINRLIARSKASWSWPEGYLEQALPLHELTATYLCGNHCFEILDREDVLIGFVSIVASGATVTLDNLWIAPERIGQGIGRQACDHVFRLAQRQGWTELWVLPDPPAEGFYRKAGFLDTGARVPSRVPGGPLFSVYRRAIPPLSS